MSVALDFALLPPEVNSARMYAGAGSGPLLVAALAWEGLAAELHSTALSYSAVLSGLTEEEWRGPASAAMAAAAAPYVLWLNTAAVQAEQTAAQAEAAAAAYEAAFAATVSPPQIAANRAQLAALVATNILGQNTPAIAATEAQYGEMWAQDAAAMYGYAGSSAAAADLTSFAAPQQITDVAGLSEQVAAVGEAAGTAQGAEQSALSQLMSSVPDSLQSLASPSSSTAGTDSFALVDLGGWNPFAPGSASHTTGLNGVLNALFGTDTAFGNFINANVWNTLVGSGFFLPGNFLGTAADFVALSQVGAGAAEGAASAAAGAAEGVAGAASGGLGAVSNSVAGLGNSALVGALSVPPSWTQAVPQSPLGSALRGTPMVAPPPAVAAGMPGVPVGNMAGQPFGRAMPHYGFKPTFVARPPAAG